MTAERRPASTIKDIARQLGISHATVSRALSDHPLVKDETRELVRRTAEALGYVPNSGARLMRHGLSHVVGLIVPDVQNEFYSAAASAMAEHCQRLGYQLNLCVSEDDPNREERHVQALRESRVEGVLIVPCGSSTTRTLALLNKLPTVQFLRTDPRLGAAVVAADDELATYMATKHLIELGHQRIALISVPRSASTGRQRIAGYELAMTEYSLKVQPSLQKVVSARPEFGYSALNELLSRRYPPTAVVIGSSRQALGALRAVRERGLSVPGDLSMVAFADSDWMQVCSPPLTAVSLPVGEMCLRATQILFGLLGKTTTVDDATLPFSPQLVLRDSASPRE